MGQIGVLLDNSRDRTACCAVLTCGAYHSPGDSFLLLSVFAAAQHVPQCLGPCGGQAMGDEERAGGGGGGGSADEGTESR